MASAALEPWPSNIGRYPQGLSDAVGGDADALLVAAGRKETESRDLVATVQMALRSVSGLTPNDMEDIMKIVVEVSDRDRKRDQ